MADILQRIIASKREEVARAKSRVPPGRLREQAAQAPAPRGFERAMRRAIAQRGRAVIAEIKRSSPSRGQIRGDVDVARIAASYEAHGATCLSVLTDGPYFGGSSEDLRTARAACGLPVLRKDFMVDPYQVHEARAWGADCILLIMDAVADDELARLAALAGELGMDVLVESHDGAQLERALRLPGLVGINNRDLRTFEIRLETTLGLLAAVPADRLFVTESGISTPADVGRLREAGVSAYLVGGSLMAAAEPGAELERLFGAAS